MQREKNMKQIQVKAEAILAARAQDIYATIADYRNGHPHIVPKENFSDIIVEEGGYGAGTTMRFEVKALGQTQHYHQIVSEPEPGRVLVEQDIASRAQLSTTFIVDPLEDGTKARVQIQTALNPSPGLQGLIERFLLPRVLLPIYLKELRQLEAFVQKQAVSS